MIISDDDQTLLLAVARQALEARVYGLGVPEVTCIGPLAVRCGAFVSIHHGGNLRGCLGRLSADAPIGNTLAHLGAAVADSDPRFAPVTALELSNLQLEISLMTPERPITSIEEIVVGRHGLIVEQGRARGVLLPQVAVEHGWAREDFVEHACLKAGLPGNAWQRGARIEIFEAQVFAEHPCAS
jgi:AmmeMemoRadiSam system protein A